MRITLDNETTKLLKMFKKEFKSAGIKTEDWSKIVSIILKNTPREAWKMQIIKNANDYFFLRKAIENPTHNTKLVHQIRSEMLADLGTKTSKKRSKQETVFGQTDMKKPAENDV